MTKKRGRPKKEEDVITPKYAETIQDSVDVNSIKPTSIIDILEEISKNFFISVETSDTAYNAYKVYLERRKD